MAQYIKNASLFGRIGTNLGKGLAEQLPKEVERGRLSAALKDVGERKNQTPFQQFTGLASLASEYPQIVQSGSELLKQKGMLQGARDRQPTNQPEQPKQSQFDAVRSNQNRPANEPRPGFVGAENTKAALRPAIPRSLRELQDRAVALNEESPGLYPDFQTAMTGAQTEDQQRIAQNTAQQGARQTQKGVETDVRKELRGLESAANAKVPDNVFQKVEDEALAEIAEGKNELAATKDARDKLEDISRDYSSIDALGDINTVLLNPAKNVRSTLRSLSKKFAKNNDSENFADRLTSRLGISNEYGHYLANEPRQEIDKKVRSLIDHNPNSIGKILGPLVQKGDSPLAIMHLLSENGIDNNPFRNHLIENKDKYDLSQSQVRELEKSDKFGQGHLNDAWLKTFGGG
jgi:hypothetical protein